MLRSTLAVLALAAWCLALSPGRAAAQVGAGTDIITGIITGEDGAPLQDATVEAMSLETQVTRRARTDARGRFTILFPDGGGQYRMTGRAIGMAPRIALLARQADEDRLVWNVRLTSAPVTLDAINVRSGPAITRMPDAPTPGNTERLLNADQLARLPVDATDLTLLASLVPGVLSIAGTDSSATAFSVAGLGADANALTLDGLLFGSSSIPQEGLRNTRVVTSTYDVSRGQFSGGLIASTTRSGSNVIQGSSQVQYRDDDLAVSAEDGQFAQGFTQSVISGGIGGPIARDRLFAFASLQARLRSDPQQTLLSAGATDYTRLGVHPDSVARFLSIVNTLGVPTGSVPSGDTRSNDNLSGLLRVDYVLTDAHTITLRGDWRGMSQDPTRLGSLALPQTGGHLSSSGGGFMATLTSRFGATIINEFRGYWQGGNRDGTGFTSLPQGRVQIASQLPDSSLGISTLVFGGNAGLPTRTRSSSVELTNELSWMPGVGSHRVKAGAYVLAERSTDLVGGNLLGTYTYNSLAALEAGQPAMFRRTIASAERQSAGNRWGGFIGDVWMLASPFQLTWGVRVEGSSFRNPPAYNAAVDAAFGVRTDRLPSETHVSPRAGFSWTLGGTPFTPGRFAPGQTFRFPTTVIRGGFGEFRSQPPGNLVAQARNATGQGQSSAELFCVGSAVPAPAWNQYWTDPTTIPDECAGSGGPLPAGLTPARSVVALSEGFEAPRAWRGSLAVERRLTQIFRLTVEGSFSRGVAQNGFRDLNLAAPRFLLAAEANRPIYVAPSDIVPSTGAPNFAGSRVDTAFGQVLLASSNLRTRSEQVTVGLGGVVRRGIVLSLSWTLQRVRDEQAGLRGGSTAGDPNLAAWARSEMERRHSMLATVTYPFSNAIELTSIGRLSSGQPYTPVVGGDVNGDGSRNDRAFLFAPGAGSAEAQGMARLLAQASPNARECLTAQLGGIAARNSCVGPWQASLDFQLNWRPAFAGLNRRMTVSVVTSNFLHGLDELLHGAAGARGWGLTTRPDGTLLYVTGYDTVAQRYTYQVNERFGATAGSASAFRPPFQIAVQVRMTVGPDRQRQALDAMRARGGMGGGMGGGPGSGPGGAGGFRGPEFSPATIINRIDSVTPNPAAVVLGMRDSLQLTPEQIRLLTPERDSVAARRTLLLDSLRTALSAPNALNDPGRLLGRMQPAFQALRGDAARALVTVRAVLTAEQWAKLPDQLKNYQAGPQFGPRPGGPGVPGGDGPRRPQP